MNSKMTPVDWAKRPLQKYADFSGRAPRAEFWWYILALIVAVLVVGLVESVIGIDQMVFDNGPLTTLLALATIIPSIAVSVRRLHDTDRTGWWILLPVAPWILAVAFGGSAVLGAAMGSPTEMMAGAGLAFLFMMLVLAADIVLLVFYVLPSAPGDNRYGPNPYTDGTGETVAAE